MRYDDLGGCKTRKDINATQGKKNRSKKGMISKRWRKWSMNVSLVYACVRVCVLLDERKRKI